MMVMMMMFSGDSATPSADLNVVYPDADDTNPLIPEQFSSNTGGPDEFSMDTGPMAVLSV